MIEEFPVHTNSGVACDLAPCDTGVCALPQTVSTSGTKVQDVGVIWVNSQSLSHLSTTHVSTKLEWEWSSDPGLSGINRLHDFAIVRIPAVSIDTSGDVDNVGVLGVEREGVDTVLVPVGVIDIVLERDPGVVGGIELVETTNIGTGVCNARDLGVEDDTSDETCQEFMSASS